MATTPDKVYKYCSLEAAHVMLETGTVRWSAPALFGDAMEPDHCTEFGFDPEFLLDSATKLASSMIFSADVPRGDSPLTNAIKRWRSEERFSSPEEAVVVLQELLSKIIDQKLESNQQKQTAWQDYSRNIRLCCFCSRPDNPVAWENFAAKHGGVCMRLDTGDNAMAGTPLPVQYSPNRPVLLSLKAQLNAILFNAPEPGIDNQQLLLVKPQPRRLEQEWRSFRTTLKKGGNADNSSLFDDIRFDARELSALCFGLATPQSDKDKLTKILKKNYPNTRVYQATLAAGKYDLELQKV